MKLWKHVTLLWFSLHASLGAQAELHIYFVDVEGGAATLIVTPQRESILIDTGWRRDDGRDAGRIHEVATRLAGLDQIDYLLTTHFHRDHYGGVLRLSELIPIRNFLDHGPMTSLREDPQFQVLYTEYQRANRGQRQKIKPGDEIPLQQGKIPLRVVCLVSEGEIITGQGGPNPQCSALRLEKDDLTDNANSVGFLLRFGNFEFLNLGDLTWNVEAKLVCPTNLIGKVDVYQVTHHGMKISNNSVLVRSVEPTVAIVNNGPKKGGSPEVFALLKSVSSVQDIFQVHRNLDTRAEDNASPDLIANLAQEADCTGHWIRVSVSADGSQYTVTNGRNGLTRTHVTR